MIIHECEVCGVPIKGEVYSLFFISNDELLKGMSSRGNPKKKIPEVCGGCKKLVEKILIVRKEGLAKLTKELEEMYKLSL